MCIYTIYTIFIIGLWYEVATHTHLCNINTCVYIPYFPVTKLVKFTLPSNYSQSEKTDQSCLHVQKWIFTKCYQ